MTARGVDIIGESTAGIEGGPSPRDALLAAVDRLCARDDRVVWNFLECHAAAGEHRPLKFSGLMANLKPIRSPLIFLNCCESAFAAPAAVMTPVGWGKTHFRDILSTALRLRELRRERFEEGLKVVRRGLDPTAARSSVRRDARSSVLIPSRRGPATKVSLGNHIAHSFGGLVIHSLLTALAFMNGEKRRPVLAKNPIKSEFLGSVRPVDYESVRDSHEQFNRPVIARIIEHCRADYIKFLSWKASFGKTEIVTLIRRLDFRGMASLKRCQDAASWLTSSIRSRHGTDECRNRALCAGTC